MLKKIIIIATLAILLAISIQAKPPQDCYTGCPDVNHNDIVDEFDLVLVALQFGKDVEPDSPYKINRTPNSITKSVNKFVGYDDLSCVGESFGENVKDFPVCKKEKDKLLAKGCECADVNKNKEVDIFDLVLVSQNFGSKEPKYKIKKDNDVVGVEDLVCVGQSFGKTGKEVGCKYCSDCGDGVLNLCDEKECIGLGDCKYTPNTIPLVGETLIGGECGEKPELYKKETGFRFATVECYDGFKTTLGEQTSCKPSETWREYAKNVCAGRCNKDNTKCGVNTLGVDVVCDKKTKETKCTDSDNSPNYIETPMLELLTPDTYPDIFVKGVTKSTLEIYKGEPLEDNCMTTTNLVEYFCTRVGDIGTHSLGCPDEYICKDGACVKEEPASALPQAENVIVPPIPPPQEKNPINPPPN